MLNYYEMGSCQRFGRLVAPIDPSIAFTFGAPPRLIKSTTWSEEFGSALEENGFSDVRQEALTGGVVTMFWATKR